MSCRRKPHYNDQRLCGESTFIRANAMFQEIHGIVSSLALSGIVDKQDRCPIWSYQDIALKRILARRSVNR